MVVLQNLCRRHLYTNCWMRRYCWKDNLSIVKCQTQSSLNNSVRSLCNLALQKQARTFQTTAQKSAESDGKDSEANFSDIPPSKLALNVLFSYGKYKLKLGRLGYRTIWRDFKFTDDVEYDDRILKFKTSGVEELKDCIEKYWKSQSYLMYADWKIKRKSSYINYDENYVSSLWCVMGTSDFDMYFRFPKHFLKNGFNMEGYRPSHYSEGTVDIYVNDEGHISRIVNRETTENDIKLAEVFERGSKDVKRTIFNKFLK